MTGPRITRAELTAAQVSEVLALVGAARLADGVAPLSEHGMLHLRYDSASQSGGGDYIVAADGEIAGYAYLDPPSAEGERHRRARHPPRAPAAGTRACAGR